MGQRIVVALGGNALQVNGESGAEEQKVAQATARQLVGLIRDGHDLVVVHGNGPQVGAILLNEEQSTAGASPLDTCVAMSQGEIGYWLQLALTNELRLQDMQKPVATIVTQIVVDAADPAFADPSKPIGPFYADEQQARDAAAAKQFVVKEDAGRGWRRVVASPRPKNVIEATFIKQAVDSGSVVIAAGGGGVPVIERDGVLQGVEAVIDKDFAAETVAELIDADILLILTAVDAVTIHFRQPNETPLGAITPLQLNGYIDQEQFAPGSMLPKAQAAVRFAQSAPGRKTIITSIELASQAVAGTAGTQVMAS